MDSLQTTTEQRIAQLQLQLAQQLNNQSLPIVSAKQESTEELINRILDEKLSKVMTTVNNLASVVPTTPEPLDYGTQMLIAIGSGITEEQQLWLSDSNVQEGIPEFLKSTEGQAITRRFFSSYKQYRVTQCK